MKNLMTISKSIFLLLGALSLFFTLSGCQDNDDSGTSYSVISESNVTGYDDWDDLTDVSWFVGKWKGKSVSKNNLETGAEPETKEAEYILTVEGINSSSNVIISESSDTSIVRNGSAIYSDFVKAYDQIYADDIFDTAIKKLEDNGVNITSVSNKKIYRKISPARDKIELYKSVVISGSYGGESSTLIVNVKESFTKIE